MTATLYLIKTKPSLVLLGSCDFVVGKVEESQDGKGPNHRSWNSFISTLEIQSRKTDLSTLNMQ